MCAAITSQPIESSFQSFMSSLTSAEDPKSFQQASKYQHWIDAMNLELHALEENNTWDITILPPGKKSIGCKWLYKTKFRVDGIIELFKARLVVLGCKQVYGVDYEQTFTPVGKMATRRARLAVAAVNDWIVVQINVMNAFLHGELDDTVYMRMPLGYTHAGCRIIMSPGECVSTGDTTLVCRLKKSLYGRPGNSCCFVSCTIVFRVTKGSSINETILIRVLIF